jgi:predicted transcriptional regulator YdeE
LRIPVAIGQSPVALRHAPSAREVGTARPIKTAIHQSIETLPGIRLAGLPKQFTPSSTAEMGGLWQRLTSHMGFDGQLGANETYGVFCKRCGNDGSFDFFAAVRIAAGCTPPEPLETMELPGRTYLVFKQMMSATEEGGFVAHYLPIKP